MEIAALIIAILALFISIASLSLQLGKHWSSHSIQLQPVDALFNPAMGKKIGSEFKSFDSPLDPDEKAYFEEKNKVKS